MASLEAATSESYTMLSACDQRYSQGKGKPNQGEKKQAKDRDESKVSLSRVSLSQPLPLAFVITMAECNEKNNARLAM